MITQPTCPHDGLTMHLDSQAWNDASWLIGQMPSSQMPRLWCCPSRNSKHGFWEHPKPAETGPRVSPVERACIGCGTLFVVRPMAKHQQYCQVKCARLHNALNRREERIMLRKAIKMEKLAEKLPVKCARCNTNIAASPCPHCGCEFMKREGA